MGGGVLHGIGGWLMRCPHPHHPETGGEVTPIRHGMRPWVPRSGISASFSAQPSPPIPDEGSEEAESRSVRHPPPKLNHGPAMNPFQQTPSSHDPPCPRLRAKPAGPDSHLPHAGGRCRLSTMITIKLSAIAILMLCCFWRWLPWGPPVHLRAFAASAPTGSTPA